MDAGIACGTTTPPALTTESIATGLIYPVYVTQAPGSTDTLWIVEKRGIIRLWRRGMGLIGTFLDMRTTIGSTPLFDDERGLLGLAFHPNYATNGRFFVRYTPTSSSGPPISVTASHDIVAEFARDPAMPDRSTGTQVQRLVDVDGVYGNHNGGMMAFGRDGYLYVAMGDGGSGCDPLGSGQSVSTLLGKILRLDVDNPPTFAAPSPPVTGGLAQIWAYGLRNPWRFSFDRMTGDLYIGDVGQNAYEEIDFQPAASTGGENYGWRRFEGTRRSNATASSCPDEALRAGSTHTPPIVEYAQSSGSTVVRNGRSVTGGYVYRGSAIPGLQGFYLYGDYFSGDIGAFQVCSGAVRMHVRTTLSVENVVSFGEDNAGELYLVYHEATTGEVRRIIPTP